MESDALLVNRARKGDRAAFAALVERHYPLLQALCWRALHDPWQVDDVTNEAVLQALLNLDRLRQPERFGAWLGGIALNLGRRRLTERRELSWEDLVGGLLADEPGPQERAEEAELTGRVRQAVMALPRGQRVAVLLYYLSGLTGAEAAAALGVEVTAVKTRLYKARQTMRRELSDIWKEDAMADDNEAVDVNVVDVQRNTEEAETRYFVLVAEKGGNRGLPIWVGAAEATAIAHLIEGVEAPRPLTILFAASTIRALDGKLVETRITRIVDSVIYAAATFEGPTGRTTIDARPSDAIALALALEAPIRIEPTLLVSPSEVGATDGNPVPGEAARHREGARELVRLVRERDARIRGAR